MKGQSKNGIERCTILSSLLFRFRVSVNYLNFDKHLLTSDNSDSIDSIVGIHSFVKTLSGCTVKARGILSRTVDKGGAVKESGDPFCIIVILQ